MNAPGWRGRPAEAASALARARVVCRLMAGRLAEAAGELGESPRGESGYNKSP